MKIFISWSGARSKAVANALRRWIPDVVNQVEVWTSEHGVDAGAVWGQELTKALDECQFGVICLTPDNQDSAWLLFEAGCLSRASRITRVVPYLFEVSTTDIRYPLAQFQGVDADRAGTLRLLQSINEAGQLQIPGDRLERAVARWWVDLEKALKAIPSDVRKPAVPQRSERDMLEELLGLVRNGLRPAPATSAETPDKSLTISLDLSRFTEDARLVSVDYSPTMRVSAFLDRVYFRINDFVRMEPYMYGREWLLQSRATGHIYTDMGRDHARARGDDEDNRPIAALRIYPRDVLQVIRPGDT